MKTILMFALGLVTAAFAFAAPSPSAAAKPGTLQVQVMIPPSWRPMFEERVADAFVSHLSDVFHQQGYQGDIVEVDAYDEPSPGCCLLVINLVEWRMNHLGNIDCTFTASIQSEHQIKQLGAFSGMGFRWMNMPGRFGLGDTFGDAADNALRELYDDLAKTGIVAGAHHR